MMMLGGASALVAAWIGGMAGVVIFLTVLIISVISPVLYSYLLYRKLSK